MRTIALACCLSLALLAACVAPAAQTNPPAAPAADDPSAISVQADSAAEPTALTEPTATAPAPLPGLCQNPLMPLAPGAAWHYQVTNPRGTFEYTIEALELAKDRTQTIGLRFTNHHANTVKEEPTVCQDGALDNYPTYFIDMLFADLLDKSLNTVHMEQPALPAYSALAGNGWVLDWNSLYQTEDGATLRAPGQEADVFADAIVIGGSSDVELAYSMDGSSEPVRVPAGDYDTLVVKHTFEFLVTIPAKYTNSAAATLRVYATQWYAPNVGLVKAQVEKAVIRSGGLEIEIPLAGTLELTGVVLP